MNRAIEEQLLEKVMSMDFSEFERLVAELLEKMGYGNRESGSIKVTQRTRDMGIDGECSTDPLGLNKVLFQAKRWRDGVGSPEIQKFVGALSGRRFNKGIFVTTSHFTPEAKKELERTNDKVEPIDGERLTKLMLRFKVGVELKKNIEIVKITED